MHAEVRLNMQAKVRVHMHVDIRVEWRVPSRVHLHVSLFTHDIINTARVVKNCSDTICMW